MNPVRKRKLLIISSALIILGLAATLILYALRQNISLFYTPTQIVNNEAPLGIDIRAGGMVVKKSIIRGAGLNVHFKITDYHHEVLVSYTGILPDLFREEQGVVVEGQLKNHQVIATRVLAKHDENYMPPEVKAALKKQDSK